MTLYHVTHYITIVIFFLNHQFITRCVKADHGSYFHNYIHKRRTNRKIKEKKEKKRKDKEEKQDIRTNRQRK